MNIPLKVIEQANLRGEKEALVWLQGSLTYRELVKKIDCLAAGLQNIGLTKGDRVAMQLLNVPEFVIAYYGIMRFGGAVVPINPLYTGREVELIMSDSGAKALITSPAFARSIKEVRANLPEFQHLIMINGEEDPEHILLKDLYSETVTAFPEPAEKDLAEIIYTSGTTGRPKGAMLSNNNLYSNAWTMSGDFQYTPEEKALIIAPLFHIAAQTAALNTTLMRGGACYLLEKWTNDDAALEAIHKHKITFFFGVPTMYVFMLNSLNLDKYDLSSLRVSFSGAAPLPVEVWNKWKEKTGTEIVEGYGLSETSPAATRNPLFGIKKPGSIGMAWPGIDVKIFDEQDHELPPNQVGEIVVRGPNVMQGYWNMPEATAEAIRNQWFHTGDLAYADDDGYIFIVDRKKDMIIRGGVNIYPREVEEVIYHYPGVLEVAVIGVPDQVMGEEVKAFISQKDGSNVDLDALREFCKQRLTHYKVPKYFAILEQLPKTASGKILKTELRKAS